MDWKGERNIYKKYKYCWKAFFVLSRFILLVRLGSGKRELTLFGLFTV